MEIAQAYIRININVSEISSINEKIETIEVELKIALDEFFGPEYYLDIEFEEGSLTGRITAGASVGMLIAFILAYYPEIKNGANIMWHDIETEFLYTESNKFSEKAIECVIENLNVTEEEVLRTEKRKRSMLRIEEIISSFDNNGKLVDIEKLTKSLEKIRRYDEFDYDLLINLFDDEVIREIQNIEYIKSDAKRAGQYTKKDLMSRHATLHNKLDFSISNVRRIDPEVNQKNKFYYHKRINPTK